MSLERASAAAPARRRAGLAVLIFRGLGKLDFCQVVSLIPLAFCRQKIKFLAVFKLIVQAAKHQSHAFTKTIAICNITPPVPEGKSVAGENLGSDTKPTAGAEIDGCEHVVSDPI